MDLKLDRRGFLTGRRLPVGIMRPPSAVAEDIFATICDGCARCIAACPQAIIVMDGGKPRLDFNAGSGACTFCGLCAESCPMAALDHNNAREWDWKIGIGADCLSYRGTACRTCADVCEAEAIRFRPLGGGRDIALVDEAACTGCGGCISICPASAITPYQMATKATEMSA